MRFLSQSILQRVGMRKLPGICMYSAKSIVHYEIKVAPRISICSSLTESSISVKGVFCF